MANPHLPFPRVHAYTKARGEEGVERRGEGGKATEGRRETGRWGWMGRKGYKEGRGRRTGEGARARVSPLRSVAAVCRAHSRDLQLMKLGCSRVACQINMSPASPLPPPATTRPPPRQLPSPRPPFDSTLSQHFNPSPTLRRL